MDQGLRNVVNAMETEEMGYFKSVRIRTMNIASCVENYLETRTCTGHQVHGNGQYPSVDPVVIAGMIGTENVDDVRSLLDEMGFVQYETWGFEHGENCNCQ